MFESKDKDLDGRLSFEEFMGEASRAEKLFKLMDKDGDGYVTKHVSAVFDHSIMKECRGTYGPMCILPEQSCLVSQSSISSIITF